ncbi:MAG: hypothetical protein INR65_09575 [Gluconacetobacter diazotrophicus]|nr:hypothetical protein [Gluconacetobacter diazotrophicus]
MDRRPARFAALALTLLWTGSARADLQPEAAAILQRMFKTYAAAPAFACEGSCDDREEGSALPPDHRTASVRFVRPDRFRLTWTQKDFHGKSSTSVLVTRDGQTTFREQGAGGDAEVEPSLERAISSCAGISLGLSYLVPALLLDDPGYLNFTDLRQDADANSGDNRPCWTLSGKTSDGAHWVLLIDRETCALREATEDNTLAPVSADASQPPPRTVHTQYRFTNIRFEGAWPDSAFADAVPPGKKKR